MAVVFFVVRKRVAYVQIDLHIYNSGNDNELQVTVVQ